MPTLTPKDQQIIAQTSVKVAGEVLSVRPLTDGEFKAIANLAFDTIIELSELNIGATPAAPPAPDVTQAAVERVQRAFPGATIGDAPAPAPGPARGPVASTPAPGAGGVEALWKHLFDNPDDWWDNRADKRNAKAPDFKAKRNGPTVNGGEPAALWISSRSTPDWVANHFSGSEPQF